MQGATFRTASGFKNYMRTDPDTQLMLDFKAGDQIAFQRLFERYKKQMVTYCYRFCGHTSVAEELAQEIFIRVYKAASRYRPKAKFRTWLYKIATNVCLNEMRRPVYRTRQNSLDQSDETGEKSMAELAATDPPSRPDALLEAQERNILVLKAMEQLPEPQRAALLLRINEDFSYREIGLQMDRSENQVKTLIHRGRKRLRKLLIRHWGENDE